MLAVEKLKRISAALLRHSTSRHHSMTSSCVTSSSPLRGDVEYIQGQNGGGGGTLKVMRRWTPPIDSYPGAVVPINVAHSPSPLPVTSQHGFDDVITPTNERCVTSFGGATSGRWPSDGDERTDTSTTSRNYFGAADAHNRTVNVNGVCFSVYGTLPRNLIRRHAKQGQGQGQGHTEGETLSDQVWSPRRQPAPSPPKRTNSIKSDSRRPTENDLDSTLTRRRREPNPSEHEANNQASENGVRAQVTVAQSDPNSGTHSVTENEQFLSFSDENADTVNHRTATPTSPVTDSVLNGGHQDSATGENGEKSAVLGEEFDSGTVKRRQKLDNGQHTQTATTQGGLEMSSDDADYGKHDVVDLDQEFDGGTLKRPQKSPTVTSKVSPPTQRVTTEDNQAKDDSVDVGDDVVGLDQEFDGGTLKRRHKSPTVTSSGRTQRVTIENHQQVKDDVGVTDDDVVVVGLDQEFDGGTLKRRQKSPTVTSKLSPPTQRVTTEDSQQLKDDAVGLDDNDVVGLDQEFKGGTVIRRRKPSADDSGHVTDCVTNDVDFWSVVIDITYLLLWLIVFRARRSAISLFLVNALLQLLLTYMSEASGSLAPYPTRAVPLDPAGELLSTRSLFCPPPK